MTSGKHKRRPRPSSKDLTQSPSRDTGRASGLRGRARQLGHGLGPGLIAGAADNDPTTVATLAVIGASTGFGLAWLVILVVPMLIFVQFISAAVGVVARAGLEDVVGSRYGRAAGLLMLLLLLGVNLLTLAADLKAGGAALGLITGLPGTDFILPLAVLVAIVLVVGTYDRIEHYLRYVTLVFLTYIGTTVLARPGWGAVLRASVSPHLSTSQMFVAGAIALLGTTLTSYAYVWETIEVAEERPPVRRLGLVQTEAGLGMVVAGIVFWFILIGTGATLGAQHKTVQTAADAAQALAPIAGRYASVLFGVGLLGSALLAAPVLAATDAYVMSEAFGWRASLDATFHQAPAFYLTLIASLVIGVGVTLLHVSAIRLLFLSSIVAGIATPITLGMMMLAARDRAVMGARRISGRLAALGWLVTIAIAAAAVIYLYQTLLS